MIARGYFTATPIVKDYVKVFEELSTTEAGLILRDSRILIPRKLRQMCIDLAHQGHLGQVMIKRLLRAKIWFP